MQANQHIIGRYALHAEIASGGMATVHIGRLLGPVGFSRTVAVKRLHPQFAKDPEFVSMFLDEARLAARIRHRNVVSVLDVVALSGELFLVMDYVEGEPLSRLLRNLRTAEVPADLEIASCILNDALLGLHAAHEAQSAQGQSLELVHRDVSPQNLLVGADGTCRVVDFGVAKASNRLQTTRDGQLKGKISYMSPEQIQSKKVDRRTDIYAAGVVLWELLTGGRLWRAEEPAAVMAQIITQDAKPPSSVRADIPPELDAVVLKALARHPSERFDTAREMALALERAVRPATASRVADWVVETAGESLRQRAKTVARIERFSDAGVDLGKGRPSFASIAPPSVPIASPAVGVPPPADSQTKTDLLSDASGINVSHRLPRMSSIPPQRWVFFGVAGTMALLVVGMLAAGSGDGETKAVVNSSLSDAAIEVVAGAQKRAETQASATTSPTEAPAASVATTPSASASTTTPEPTPTASSTKPKSVWPTQKPSKPSPPRPTPKNKWDQL